MWLPLATSPDIARKLYAAWNGGDGFGSEEHADAMKDAIDAVVARGL